MPNMSSQTRPFFLSPSTHSTPFLFLTTEHHLDVSRRIVLLVLVFAFGVWSFPSSPLALSCSPLYPPSLPFPNILAPVFQPLSHPPPPPTAAAGKSLSFRLSPQVIDPAENYARMSADLLPPLANRRLSSFFSEAIFLLNPSPTGDPDSELFSPEEQGAVPSLPISPASPLLPPSPLVVDIPRLSPSLLSPFSRSSEWHGVGFPFPSSSAFPDFFSPESDFLGRPCPLLIFFLYVPRPARIDSRRRRN